MRTMMRMVMHHPDFVSAGHLLDIMNEERFKWWKGGTPSVCRMNFFILFIASLNFESVLSTLLSRSSSILFRPSTIRSSTKEHGGTKDIPINRDREVRTHYAHGFPSPSIPPVPATYSASLQWCRSSGLVGESSSIIMNSCHLYFVLPDKRDTDLLLLLRPFRLIIFR